MGKRERNRLRLMGLHKQAQQSWASYVEEHREDDNRLVNQVVVRKKAK